MVDKLVGDARDSPLSKRQLSRPPAGYWRVAVVEDHLLQRKRTEELLGFQDDLQVVCSVETLPEFAHWLKAVGRRSRPHLLILDLSVDRGPSADPDAVRSIVGAGIRVLVLSALASVSLVRAVIHAGVAGIVGKRDSEHDILDAARLVLDGGQWMTPELAGIIAGDTDRPRLSDQEERALVLYATGLTMSAVASALGVKPATAKQYLDRVKAKYTAAGRPIRTKVDITHAAISDGFIDPPGGSRRT